MVDDIVVPPVVYINPESEIRTILEQSLEKPLPQKYSYATGTLGENTDCGGNAE